MQTQAKEVLPLLQNVIDEANKISLTINSENFYQACESPASFFKKEYSAIIEKEQVKPSVAGFRMKTSVILDQFELPETSLFEKAASMVMANLKIGVIPPDILTIENSKACIDEIALKTIVDSYCIFATNEKEVTLWNELTKVSESLNKFNTFVNENHNMKGIDRNNISHYVEERGGTFSPQLQFYLSLTRQ